MYVFVCVLETGGLGFGATEVFRRRFGRLFGRLAARGSVGGGKSVYSIQPKLRNVHRLFCLRRASAAVVAEISEAFQE